MNRPPPSPGLRVLLVDDHTIVREGLKRILDATHDGWIVAEESSGFRALDNLRHAPCDLAVVDLSMPGMSGLELIRRIRTEFTRLPVLVLSMHAEEEYALRAFKAGANGYVTTSLAERVVQQLNGSVEVPRHAKLTDREMEVLRRIVAGQRSGEIAEALHLSAKTISTHKTRIMDKLQATSTAALVRYGMQHGMLPDNAEPAAGWDSSAGPSDLQ